MASEWNVGSQLLRRLRESRGWSWSGLARAMREMAEQLGISSFSDRQLTSIQRSIARWENHSDPTCPGDRYQVVLANLYARSPTGIVTMGDGSDFAVLMDSFRSFGVSERRIAEVVGLIVSTTTDDDPESRLGVMPAGIRTRVVATRGNECAPSDDLLEDLRVAIDGVNEAIGSVPFSRLQLRLAPFVEACRQISPTGSTDVPDTLATLKADTFALAARLAFEARDDELSRMMYSDAVTALRSSGDLGRRGAIKTSFAMVTLHSTGNLVRSRSLARSATRDAHCGRNDAAMIRAHAVHAEICARAGEADEARAALGRAWRLADGQPTNGTKDPVATRLRGFEGLCSLYSGNASAAHGALAATVHELQSPRDAVQRGIVVSDLAMAALRRGDAFECAGLLHQAVDLAVKTGGRVSAQRVHQTRRELRPWKSENFVADLDDHLHDVLIR